MKIELEKYRNLIIDMDGVLYRGNKPLPGSGDFISFWRARGGKVAFFSNNSTLTKSQYVEKLKNMGIPAQEEEIIHSALITGYCLQQEIGTGKVYLIGEAGIREELVKRGFQIEDDPSDYKVESVVVGMDRSFTFKKMSNALRCILNGAFFFGTNPDTTFPSEDGLLPGCGAILASIQACSQVNPRIFGKPNPESLKVLLEFTGFNPGETILVGDRLDTDIKLGQDFSLFSVLVLTGITQADELDKSPISPDLVVENLVALKNLMAQGG